MKAWVLHDVGKLTYDSVDMPAPAVNEVLVEVKAVGICGSDIPRIYQNGAYSHPLIPGHEFAGVVTKVGTDVDAAWLEKRVGVFPLIPCKKCGPCRKQKYEMCRSYSYLGSRRDGAFAEYVVVPVENLIVLPEVVSFEAAAMFEPMAVAVHAMRRVMPKASERVVVCGLGTIGLLLLMFLQEAGVGADAAGVLVIGNKDFQREQALKLGVTPENYCDSRTQNVEQWIAERTAGDGADVFFECVGKNETFSWGVNCAAPSGRVLLVGNPFTDMHLERSVYWKILRNQLTVTGTWNSSFTGEDTDDWNYMLDKLAAGSVAPEELITHRYSLAELETGFHIMRDKSEDYVKVMGVLD